MRLFEILILATLLPPLLWPVFSRNRPKWLALFPLLGLLFSVVHLLVEGYRWQMFPAYGLTAVFLFLTIRWATTNPAPSRLAKLGGLLGLFVWFMALALPVALPVPRLPTPTGLYAIGTFTTYLVDTTRPETYTDDPSDNRELVVQVWYPAANHDGEPAQYMPDLDVAGPVIAEQFGLPAFLLDHINLTELDVWLDIPPANDGAPFPVIIFSHGLTGIRTQNTVMVRELVSHGYIVAAIDHSYANALTIFPDGRIFIYDPSRIFPSGESNPVEANPLVQVWAEDIGFLLDEMAVWGQAEGHLLYGRFDLNHVGIFGHSTGGGAAMEFCLQDARCQAGVGLDSWLLPVSGDLLDQDTNPPFMFISTSRWLGPENRALGNRLFNNLSQDGYNLTLAHTEHYDFTDLPLLTPLTPQLDLSGSINSGYSLGIQSEYLLAFFDQYLKGEPSALLMEAPSPYPELTIARNLRP
jgi:hypothetical protein